MNGKIKIGVLALQGDFARHLDHLEMLNIAACEVRRAGQLSEIDGLIIPGGESTTMSELIDRFGMRPALEDFCHTMPVWGTCAGMIMLATEVDHDMVHPLKVIDITVRRNGYGRQVDSFFTEIEARLNGRMAPLKASFIRAPQVSRHAPDISILATYKDSPVLLAHRKCLVSSFHTELNDDLSLTRFFIERFVSVVG